MGLSGALNSGVTGIRSHQSWMDVIGNNLANINTYGYKSSRLLFSDLISQSKSGGGENPMQVGMGVQTGSIASIFSQGTLEATNNEFDFAIEGDGFFVANGGDKDYFLRVGAFSTDENNYLVDTATGYQIVDSSGNAIEIPYDSTVSASATSKVTISGSLESTSSDSSGEVLQLSSALTTDSSGTLAASTTDLNDLYANTTDYTDGSDTIIVSGTKADGTSFSATFTYGTSDDGTTVGDLITFLNGSSAFNSGGGGSGDATASFDTSTGKIAITADSSGNDELSLSLSDGNTSTGTWDNYDFVSSAYTTTTTIYDSQGVGHSITLNFIKTADNTWTMRATMDSDDGIISDDEITSITFDDSGNLQSLGDATLQFDFDGIGSTQSVDFDLGTIGKSNGVYQTGDESSVTASQDGYEAGTYSSFSVDTDGTLYALYTNGSEKKIAQLQIALFDNVNGLAKAGDNLWEQTAASGEPVYTTGGSGNAGDIYNGYLESSNVDMTSELTSLIMAQRGFQLNSRVITTADDVLAEAVNIKR